MINILVADDDKNTRLLMKAILEAEHYHVFTAEDGQQALELLDIDSVIRYALLGFHLSCHRATSPLSTFRPSFVLVHP